MNEIADTFTLLDLPTQAHAVERLLSDRSLEDKVAWLQSKGILTPIGAHGNRPAWRFKSCVGIECLFFFKGQRIVFIGDNTRYVANDGLGGGMRPRRTSARRLCVAALIGTTYALSWYYLTLGLIHRSVPWWIYFPLQVFYLGFCFLCCHLTKYARG